MGLRARLALLAGSLILALAVGALALRTPAPRPPDAPIGAFSAERALHDVREMARAPRPVGSAPHARTRAYLLARMTQLGLSPQTQAGPLSPAAIRRMDAAGLEPGDAEFQAVNLVGVLPGADPLAPAVLMMAHYDSTPTSPGAADDAAGVSAILETVRALRARGPAPRTLVVLLTDAEELNLDGARIFFSDHPLRDRIGAVVNLEARGGGGRAAMFETGPGNAETVDLFARAAGAAPGGPYSSSLAVFVYRLMPNGTDFTISRNRGLAGANFAFIGRPAQYHSPSSTADALDPGSLQHMGSLALETVDALLRAPDLPRATRDRVYSDILGLFVVRHAPETGWALLGLAAALAGLAAWGAARAGGLTAAETARGAAEGLWVLTTGVVMAQATRVLAGPLSGRAESAADYYTLLRRLPWMEAGAGLAVLGVALAALAGRALIGRRIVTGVVFAAAVTALAAGGFNPVILATALASLALGWFGAKGPRSVWGAWLGLIGLVWLLGLAAQAAAPEAAFLLVWTGLLAALAAAATAIASSSLGRRTAFVAPAVATVLGGAWLAGFGHGAFLGIGMDLPGVLAVIGLLVLTLARPLAPPVGARRGFAAAAAVCLVLACGVSVAARWAEPAPAPPGMSR